MKQRSSKFFRNSSRIPFLNPITEPLYFDITMTLSLSRKNILLKVVTVALVEVDALYEQNKRDIKTVIQCQHKICLFLTQETKV